MIKSKTFLLPAVLFFSVLFVVLVFNRRVEQKIVPEEIAQYKTTFEDIKEDSVKTKTAEKEIIEEEKVKDEAERKKTAEDKIAGEKTSEEIKKPETKSEELEDYPETSWQWLKRQKPIYQLSAAEIKSILKELTRQFPDKEERLKALVIWRLGTPYQPGPLGEEKGRDPDPIFRTDVADCTVFVLTTAALFHSNSLEGAREMMKFLNYRSQEITFENRLHFTTDRNSVSPYFSDITGEVAGSKVQNKTVILNKKRTDGTRLIDINWEREIVLKYIPSQHITVNFLAGLPKFTGIAFIRQGDEEIGLDIRHEGFLVDGKKLIHASAVQGKVVEENFLNYYFIEQTKPRFDGIILFRIN